MKNLHEIVAAIMQDGKGVLMLGGDSIRLEKQFSSLGIPYSDEAKHAYYELLFGTPGIEEFISTTIIPEELFSIAETDGTIFSESLAEKDILVGTAFADGTPEDCVSRMQLYKSSAAVCAKRNAVFRAEDDVTSVESQEHIDALVLFAEKLQGIHVVPILGIELLGDSPHSALQAETALTRIYSTLADALKKSNVDLKGCILETTFASTGIQNPALAEANEVAERSTRALSASISHDVGGVLFASAEENPQQMEKEFNATARLEPLLWPIAFSLDGRLLNGVRAAWAGKEENRPSAQALFLEQLSLLVVADRAGYVPGMDAL